jgi:hypothetical protein
MISEKMVDALVQAVTKSLLDSVDSSVSLSIKNTLAWLLVGLLSSFGHSIAKPSAFLTLHDLSKILAGLDTSRLMASDCRQEESGFVTAVFDAVIILMDCVVSEQSLGADFTHDCGAVIDCASTLLRSAAMTMDAFHAWGSLLMTVLAKTLRQPTVSQNTKLWLPILDRHETLRLVLGYLQSVKDDNSIKTISTALALLRQLATAREATMVHFLVS